ncbi:hypothetical protein ACFO0N_10765 [Halobium salinum]|uniref:Uncharacterized protein n=1 Tax=Halobium salinum TaxID=1364940 RepID=A0ABD5PBY6_9EURY|nr:hypothetical protein [Halobium salinum]
MGATPVSRYLDGLPPADAELDLFARQVEVAKGPDYPDKHPVRHADVYDHALDLNGRGVLPKLRGDRLVDDACGSDAPAAAD